MVRIFTFLSLTVAVLIATGCAAPTSSRGPSSAQAVIRAVSGHAEISRAGSDWEPARPGTNLSAGDRLKTWENATIDVSLPHSGVFTLRPDSFLEIEQLGPTSSATDVVAIVNLSQGRIVGDTLDLRPPRKMLVKTRSGTVRLPER